MSPTTVEDVPKKVPKAAPKETVDFPLFVINTSTGVAPSNSNWGVEPGVISRGRRGAEPPC